MNCGIYWMQLSVVQTISEVELHNKLRCLFHPILFFSVLRTLAIQSPCLNENDSLYGYVILIYQEFPQCWSIKFFLLSAILSFPFLSHALNSLSLSVSLSENAKSMYESSRRFSVGGFNWLYRESFCIFFTSSFKCAALSNLTVKLCLL